MKTRKMLGVVITAATLAATAIMPNTVMADATKVVTLGADLSAEQQNTMMKYFKANKDEVEIIYVTNADERRFLSSYISSAQIGTRTVSCAYVKPTKSGGIKVRTANLNYVTCNMIASTLSTSGVTNCEVVAACPFEVSGTGALTGIMMAYEHATGKELDPVKKDIATHEMVVTGNLAETINSDKDAINVINSGKMEVVENNIQNTEAIQQVVVNIAQENNVNIDQNQLDEIVSLLEEIARQDYDYESMKETLESVEANVNDDVNEDLMPAEEPTDNDDDDWEVVAEDSILDEVDITALGADVLESSTEDASLAIESGLEAAEEEDEWVYVEEDNDEWTIEDNGEEIADDGTVLDGTGMDDMMVDPEDEMDLSLLTEEQREKFEHLETFCKGVFEGDVEAWQKELETDTWPSVTLESEIAEKITKDVQKLYYNLLKDGTDDYFPTAEDVYFTPELNILAKELKDIFDLEGFADPDYYMTDVDSMDRQTLYDDLMTFFEKLYGETAEVESDEWNEYPDEASYDEEAYDEMPEEESYEEDAEEVEW